MATIDQLWLVSAQCWPSSTNFVLVLTNLVGCWFRLASVGFGHVSIAGLFFSGYGQIWLASANFRLIWAKCAQFSAGSDRSSPGQIGARFGQSPARFEQVSSGFHQSWDAFSSCRMVSPKCSVGVGSGGCLCWRSIGGAPAGAPKSRARGAQAVGPASITRRPARTRSGSGSGGPHAATEDASAAPHPDGGP